MSIVGHPLFAVCCQLLLQTSALKLIGLGPFNIWYVALPSYQVCSDGGPWVQNGPEVGRGLGFRNEIYLKIFFFRTA